MKRILGIFMFSAAVTIAANGSVTGIMVQNSDTLNINKFLKVYKFGLEILSPSSGVQFYRDGIVFLFQTKSEAKMLESHTSFGATEAYYGVLKDTSVSNQILFSQSFSWTVPCEAMTFNSDYSIMYYTKRPSNKEPEKIFQARYQLAKNGKREWISDSNPLSFCTDKSVYSHPALSANGEKMVFTSNRSESIGGLDLFISNKEASGWSSPTNLGNLINTRGNELSPYLDQDNNLFFSSDGIEGFGGYDIYVCRYNGRGWEKPANLTKMINTKDDELAFTLSRPDGKSAFFTTRYKAGNRPPQLFRIAFRDQYALKEMTNLSDAFKYIAHAELKPVTEPAQPQKLPEVKKQEPVKTAVKKAASSTGNIVFRVQFSSNTKSKGSYEITIGGKKYKTFEYLYNGAYRSCAGEFSTSASAHGLQKQLKQEGFQDAFVIATKGKERATDPALFKK